MIITLTGENGFGLKTELDRLIAEFVMAEGDFALERVDGEDVEFNRLNEALTSLPFLANKKMVVLSRASANKQFNEKAEQLLAGLPETTELILVEPKLDKRLGYYKLLKKITDFQEFKALDINTMARWLSEQAELKGGVLQQRDAMYLVERVGLDQQLLENELEKLLLYNSTITQQTIDLLTEAAPQSTIFQLLEAAFVGNVRQTMKLYDEQRALKVEPQQLIALLSWQLHITALIKAGGQRSADTIASEAKVSAYVVRKSQGIARKLSLVDLRMLIADLLDIDARSKRQAIDLDEVLQNYLLKLAA